MNGECDSCRRERCQNCGERDDLEDGRCSNCRGPILDHFDKSKFDSVIGTAPHYFGVELEVECGDEKSECAERVSYAIGDLAVLKEDGSLDAGFEIVTKPMSLDKQTEFWSNLLTPRNVRHMSSFGTDTCGLHVHASRQPLTELTVAKIVCFVNASHNRKFIETIAQRRSCTWARIQHKKLVDANKRNPARYEAVNLQNVKSSRDSDGRRIMVGTIEFRIFKGTLKKESVLKSIQFVAALIEFCKPAERSLKDSVSRARFVEFVHQNRKLYPHLSAFISARWEGEETKGSVVYGYKAKDGVVKNAELENDGEV